MASVEDVESYPVAQATKNAVREDLQRQLGELPPIVLAEAEMSKRIQN